MVLVALAGPATNIALALFAAAAFHLLPLVPASAAQWVADNLKNALVINVVLAVFNMLPIPSAGWRPGSRSGCCQGGLPSRFPGWNLTGC